MKWRENEYRKELFTFVQTRTTNLYKININFLLINGVTYSEDYVGTDDGTSDSKMVYEICSKLAKLRMEWKTTSVNRLMTDTPDELYAKYISIVDGLPNDATV